MSARSIGVAWLVFGLLWLSLTGLCTLSLWQSSEAGALAALGLPVVAIGLFPLAMGIERLAAPLIASRVFTILGVALTLPPVGLILWWIWEAQTHGGSLGETLFGALVAVAFYVTPGSLVIWRGRVLAGRRRWNDG